MPKRPAKSRQPADTQPWRIRPASARVHRQWQRAIAAEPELMADLRERLRLRPLDRSDNPNRTHRLRGQLAEKWIGDVKLPQWQHQITSAGRVFYCPDRDAHVVWVTMATIVREAIDEKLATARPRPRSIGSGASGKPDIPRRSADESPEPRAWR
jgi:hypothetical protein